MTQIFASYSRRDAKIVDRLINRLEEAGYSVWVDREDIRGGRQWRRAIVEAIDHCQVFISLLSPNSIASDNVRKEMDVAEGSKKPILPVMLHPVQLPTHLRYQLAGLQIIDLSQDFETGFVQLIESLVEQGVKPTSEPSATAVPMHASRWDSLISNRWLWAVAAVTILLLISIIVIVNLGDGESATRQNGTEAAMADLTTSPTPTTITPTPPTTTNTPTSTITPTVPPTLTDTPSSAEDIVLFHDDFSSDNSEWSVEPYEGDLYYRKSEFVDEKLRMTVITKPDADIGTYAGHWVPDLTVKNFHIRLEATIVEAPEMAGIVVGFRIDDNWNHYEVVFRKNGNYKIKLLSEGDWQPDIQTARLRDVMALDIGVKNIIDIKVKDSTITVYGNDRQLAKVTDTRLSTAGRIWIGVELYEADQTIVVDFDNLSVNQAR